MSRDDEDLREVPQDTRAGLDFAETGIRGLDFVLNGGLPRGYAYLIQGHPGSGKSTLAMQFCMAGAKRGERVLFLTTCESENEMRAIAQSHGWSLDGVTVHYHDPRECLGNGLGQSVFHPAEVELPETMEAIVGVIEEVNPQRLVIDSLSEIRLLAADPRWFRRQMLALKTDLAGRCCTTLFCDDQAFPDQPIQSLVHGVIELEQVASEYGPDRRWLRIRKLRGHSYASGYHDLRICTGGLEIYPRLIAAEYRQASESRLISSGLPKLDNLFGGGVDQGTSTLLLGPAGTGKSIVATQFAVAAAERGERSVIYVFDERIQTLLSRARGIGLDLEGQVSRGMVEVRQVDPAELSPGEFSHEVQRAVSERDTRLVMIDSLAGYIHAMPNERMLTLYLHELLSYLGQMSVSSLLVMTQHGVPGTQRAAPFDLSYIADSVLLFHSFEHAGELRRAISVYKRRTGDHERLLRELQFGPEGIQIGEPLRQFQGISTGAPQFIGTSLPRVQDEDQS